MSHNVYDFFILSVVFYVLKLQRVGSEFYFRLHVTWVRSPRSVGPLSRARLNVATWRRN
jgi:hypothetical protein